MPFNFLNARTEDARHEIESASTQLELLVQPTLVPNGHAAPNSSLDENAAQHAIERKQRELQRLAIQQQIAQLQAELDHAELGLGRVTGRQQPVKE